MKQLLLTITILLQFICMQAQDLQAERDTLKKPLVKSANSTKSGGGSSDGGSSAGIAPVSMPIMPSPTASSLVRNATASPNLYTGAVNVSIPLYTLPAQGMSIPIGLVYQSNGVKVNEKNGPLGMTWNLQGGGAVARVVRGYPDEFEGEIIKETWSSDNPREKNKKKTKLKAIGFWHTNIPTDFATNKDSYQDIIDHSEGEDDDLWDTEPDKYFFSAPGLAGSFYIPQKNAAPIIHCDADIDIQVHFEDNQLMGFVITSASGVCYEFGMNSAYMEMQTFSTISRVINAKHDHIGTDRYELKFQFEEKAKLSKKWFEDKNAYISTWYLKRIITPFHADNILYTYAEDADTEEKLAQSLDVILDKSFNYYELINNNTEIKVFYNPEIIDFLEGAFIAKQIDTKIIHPKRLTKITSSSSIVNFSYSNKNIDNCKRITSISIYDTDGAKIKKQFDLNYDYVENKISEPLYPNLLPIGNTINSLIEETRRSSQSGRIRYFLNKISEIDKFQKDTIQLYSFTYHKPEQLPIFCSQFQNQYGFYVNYPDFKSQFYIDENSKYYPLLALDIQTEKGKKTPNLYQDGSQLSISDTTVTNGILVSMQNATGAVSKYIYDATFEGALLKHTYIFDGKNKVQETDYSYQNPSTPLGSNSRIYNVGINKIGITPWGRSETSLTQGVPIGYSLVTATTNHSKSKYYFTTSADYNNTIKPSTTEKEIIDYIYIDRRSTGTFEKFYNIQNAIIFLKKKSRVEVLDKIEENWIKLVGKENSEDLKKTVWFHKYFSKHFNEYSKGWGWYSEIIFKKELELITEFSENIGRPTERDQLRGRIVRKENYNLKGKLTGVEEYDYSTIFLNKYEAKAQPFIVSESYIEASEDKYIVPYSIDYETLRLNGVKSTSYVSENESVSSESTIEKYSQIHPLLPEISVQKNLNTNDIVRSETEYLVFSGSNPKSSKKPLQKGKVDIDDNDDDQGGTGGSYTNNSPKYNSYPKYTTKKQVVYKNDQQLSGSEVIYNQSTCLPEQVKTWIDGKYETSITYDKFDNKSRLLEAHGRDGIPTSYRYNGNFLEMTAQNATYQEISNGKAKDLRKNLYKAIITSANYSSEGFLLNQTDANGYSVYYEYDDFGRLKLLRDHDKNLIKAYGYQYGKVGQETISTDKLGIGQMVVGENFVVGGYSEAKTQGLPSAGKNFISSYTFNVANSEFEDRDAPNRAAIAIEYQDGLGRAIQQVAINSLPQEYNLIQSFEYDSLGRQAIQYRSLPILSDSKYKKDWKQFLKGKYETSYKAESSFDAYNRIQKQGSFGENYALNKHASTNQYGMNQVSIPSYKAELAADTYQKKDYPKGTLYKTAVSFEGITNVSYKNMDGQVVRKAAVRGIQTGDPDYGSALITDYVYDDYGNLRAILPPQAKGDISAGNYVYKFLYDKRNRLVKKEIPGAGSIILEYDDLDRLIHETDAKGTTSYIKYDELSRPVETGYSSNQSAVNSGSEIALSKTYYDNYDFTFAKGNPCSSDRATNNLGRITGSETRILGSDTWIKAVSYYDKEGRVIEAISQNNTGGIDKVRTAFDFQGKVTETKVNKTFNGEEFSTKRQYDYGTTGELLNVHHSVNGQSSVVLSSFEYNSDGSLAGKKVHNGKIETQYTYDELNRMIKSQSEKYLTLELAYDTKLKGANNSEYYDGSLSAMAWETKSQKRHTYSFGYDGWKNLCEASSDDHPYTAQYQYDANGNMSFLSRNDSLGLFQKFKYDYENTNQLRKLDRTNTEKVEVWPGDANNDGKVEVDDQHPVGYDYKFTIKPRDTRSTEWKAWLVIRRKGDQMVFSDTNGDGLINETDTIAIYQNLLKEHQLAEALKTNGFRYEYDKNGNMVYDEYKKISISYNLFNLPDTIIAEGQGKIVNQYLADGTLLRRSIFDADDNEVQRIDYQGEFLFVGDELDKIFTEEGYYKPTEASQTKKSDLGTYYYTLADHLGHTRVVVDEEENVLQETAYYPYGTPIVALSSETKYNYLYTGKEFLDNFGLNWYDHHARFFDPEVGRWWAIDPALQCASPYMAMGNNPMMNIDEDGKTWGVFNAFGNAWDYAWGKGNQFARWADKNGIPSFSIGIGMNSGGQVNPMVNGQEIEAGYTDPGAVASASIDQQRSQYSSPTHTGVTGGAVYTSPAISVGPLIFNGAWSYYPGEGTFNYSLAQVTLRTWWERSSGRVEVTDSPIDYLVGAGIGKAIGKGFIKAITKGGSRKLVNLADDAFVHVAPSKYVNNILKNGLDPAYSGGKSYVTRWGNVKNITNASDFSTVLYRQNLWKSTVGKFDEGATILHINSKPTFYSPRTNWVNGVPQYIFTSPVSPKYITPITSF